MICCREVTEVLIDYVTRELPADQCSQVDQHLCSCPACVAFVHSYQMTIKLCRKLPAQPVPAQVIARLNAQMH
jgi:anti-sigma factor RsiW